MGFLDKFFPGRTAAAARALEIRSSISQLHGDLSSAFTAAKAMYEREEALRSAYMEQVQLLDEMANAAGGLLWRKNEHGEYLFANHLRCTKFFGLSECDDYIGHNDEQLITQYMSKANVRHTFLNVCEISDKYVNEAGKKCRFMEFGIIGDKPVVLSVIKTPVYDKSGRYTGTVGFALDVSEHCNSWAERVENMVVTGEAKKLAEGLYLINPNIEACDASYLKMVFDNVDARSVVGRTLAAA